MREDGGRWVGRELTVIRNKGIKQAFIISFIV